MKMKKSKPLNKKKLAWCRAMGRAVVMDHLTTFDERPDSFFEDINGAIDFSAHIASSQVAMNWPWFHGNIKNAPRQEYKDAAAKEARRKGRAEKKKRLNKKK